MSRDRAISILMEEGASEEKARHLRNIDERIGTATMENVFPLAEQEQQLRETYREFQTLLLASRREPQW